MPRPATPERWAALPDEALLAGVDARIPAAVFGLVWRLDTPTPPAGSGVGPAGRWPWGLLLDSLEAAYDRHGTCPDVLVAELAARAGNAGLS